MSFGFGFIICVFTEFSIGLRVMSKSLLKLVDASYFEDIRPICFGIIFET